MKKGIFRFCRPTLFLSCILVFALFAPLAVLAQNNAVEFEWAKRIGGSHGDRGHSIVVDKLGNIYSTGYFSDTADFDPEAGVYNLMSAGDWWDAFISKFDADGNFVWARQIGGGDRDMGSSIANDDLGNIYVTGQFEGSVVINSGADTFALMAVGDRDIFIAKLDTDGNFIWVKQMGGAFEDEPLFISVDASGNIYSTGWFGGPVDFDLGPDTFALTSAGEWDIYVSKLDTDGNLIWAKQMGGGSFDFGASIAMDAFDNLYIVGAFTGTSDFDPSPDTFSLTSAGGFDIFASKLDTDGNFIWTKKMGGGKTDQGLDVAVDALGNLYITGAFFETVDFDPGPDTFALTSEGGFDIFVSKMDTDGNFVWAKNVGGNISDACGSIAIDSLGNLYFTGYFGAAVDFDPGPNTFNLVSEGDVDIFVSKMDTDGNFVWAKKMGGDGTDSGLSLFVDTDGSIYITGRFSETADFDPGIEGFSLTSAGGTDIFAMKLSQLTSGVSIPPFFDEFNIYPNPASDHFTLHLEGQTQSNIFVELLNGTGQVLFRENLLFPGFLLKNYSCQNIPKGVYLVRVFGPQGSAVHKVIIE